jgi:APA family basic amino acid/polyamine antiporter
VGATGVIVAAIVGSGIFAQTGQFGASVVSPLNLIAPWVIGGFVALCGGLSLAELGAMIPCSGGSVEFARRAYGKTIGYLTAMVTLLAGYLLAIAVVALFLASFVDKLFEADVPDHAVAVAAIAAAFLSQLPGLRAGFAFNTALSVLKVGFVAAFAVAGLLVPVGERLSAPVELAANAPGLFSSAVASATLAVSFAYLGWSSGADIAGDITRPGRNIPRSIIASIGIVFVLYIGVNLAYLRVIDPAAMVESDGKPMQAIGSVAATLLFGEAIGRTMTAFIAVLLFSTIVSGLITAARICESMAHAGEIPAWAGVRRPNGVPLRALTAMTVLGAAMLAIGPLGEILDLLTVLVAVFSSLSVAAVMVLRRTMPDAPRPFRVPLYPLTPIAYLGIATWGIVSSVTTGGMRAAISSLVAIGVLVAIQPLLRQRRSAA